MDQDSSTKLTPEERIAQLEKQIEAQLQQIIALQKTVVDWHSAVFGALNLILKPHKFNLTLEREHLLNLMPTRMDCLVIKKDESIPIELDAFRIFSKHNVIEFKSYNDELDEDVLWRTIGYATSYISLEKDVSAEEVSITVLRTAFPRKLFGELQRHGWTVAQPYHNIFYLSGKVSIPIQIVVAKELGDEYLPLQILTGNAREADVRKFADYRAQLSDLTDRYYADSVMWACSEANGDLFRKLKEDEKMASVLREIMKDELAQEREKGLQEGMRDGLREGRIITLFESVQDGDILLDRAARRAGQETSVFLRNMREAGYTVPEARA